MSKKTKMTVAAVVLVVILGGAAYLYSNGANLQGRFTTSFDYDDVMENYPDFECDTTTSTVVVSTPSTATGTRTSSQSSSYVPACIPLEDYNRWGHLWE